MTSPKDKTIKREVGEKVRIHLSFDPATTKDLADGVLEATITTSAEDRHNERIITDGIKTDTYMETNPTVLYGHDYGGLPIGKTLKLSKTKNKIKARFQLAIEEYPFANTVYSMVKAGYLNAVSIGGKVLEWSDDYREILQMEMVEFSIVPIPANPEAIITGRAFEDAVGKSMDEVSEEFAEFNHKSMLDKLSSMSDNEVNRSIKTLKNLLGVLEEAAQAQSSEGSDDDQQVTRIKRIRLSDAAKAVNRESERTIRLIKVRRS